MLENIGMIAGMKGMAIAEHAEYSTRKEPSVCRARRARAI